MVACSSFSLSFGVGEINCSQGNFLADQIHLHFKTCFETEAQGDSEFAYCAPNSQQLRPIRDNYRAISSGARIGRARDSVYSDVFFLQSGILFLDSCYIDIVL